MLREPDSSASLVTQNQDLVFLGLVPLQMDGASVFLVPILNSIHRLCLGKEIFVDF